MDEYRRKFVEIEKKVYEKVESEYTHILKEKDTLLEDQGKQLK